MFAKFFGFGPKQAEPAQTSFRTPSSVLVVSKEAILKSAAKALYNPDRLRRDMEDYTVWVEKALPEHIDELFAGATVGLYARGYCHWITNKPLRVSFAASMFGAGVYCYYTDNNNDMGAAEQLIMQLRKPSQTRFDPRDLNNPLCPNDLEN